MTKIIGVYGIDKNVGKSTISQSLAHIIATADSKVLYVEFDYVNPSFAKNTTISHEQKNIASYMEQAMVHENFAAENYILRKRDLDSLKFSKATTKVISLLPHNLDLLVFPRDYISSDFPKFNTSIEEKVEQFMELLMGRLRHLEYDAVVINLPSQIDNIFGLPVLLHCDHVVSIMNSSPASLAKFIELSSVLSRADLSTDNWIKVFNLCSPNVEFSIYEQLLNVNVCIPFDVERADYEFELRIGSPKINEHIKNIARDIGFYIKEEEKRYNILRRI